MRLNRHLLPEESGSNQRHLSKNTERSKKNKTLHLWYFVLFCMDGSCCLGGCDNVITPSQCKNRQNTERLSVFSLQTRAGLLHKFKNHLINFQFLLNLDARMNTKEEQNNPKSDITHSESKPGHPKAKMFYYIYNIVVLLITWEGHERCGGAYCCVHQPINKTLNTHMKEIEGIKTPPCSCKIPHIWNSNIKNTF